MIINRNGKLDPKAMILPYNTKIAFLKIQNKVTS